MTHSRKKSKKSTTSTVHLLSIISQHNPPLSPKIIKNGLANTQHPNVIIPELEQEERIQDQIRLVQLQHEELGLKIETLQEEIVDAQDALQYGIEVDESGFEWTPENLQSLIQELNIELAQKISERKQVLQLLNQINPNSDIAREPTPLPQDLARQSPEEKSEIDPYLNDEFKSSFKP